MQLPKTVNSFAISPTRPLVVLGGDDGALSVHELGSHPSSRGPVTLKGAVGDILSTTFFPSGEVTLSTTLASTLLVHSALPVSTSTPSSSNEPVRVLKGHTRAVTCTAILGRGKHVLSGSKDKTVKRWDVANAVAVGSVDFGDEVWAIGLESDHVGWVGLKSGGLWRIDLDDLDAIKHAQVGIEGGKEGGVQALAIKVSRVSVTEEQGSRPSMLTRPWLWTPLQGGLLAVGTERGILSLYSLAASDTSPTLMAKVQRSTGGINSLAFLPDGRLVVGGEDSMPWIAGADLHTLEDGAKTWGVSEELAGWEDPIVAVRTTEKGEIWVASAKEGVARY